MKKVINSLNFNHNNVKKGLLSSKFVFYQLRRPGTQVSFLKKFLFEKTSSYHSIHFFMTMTQIKVITTIVLLAFFYSCTGNDQEKAAEYMQSARTFMAQHKPKSAALEYLNVLQRDPGNDVAMFELAETYILLKEINKAVIYYKLAAEANPDNIIVNLRLGQVFLASGKLLEARTTVSEILEKAPDSIEAYHLLSGIHIQERNIEAAIETLEKVAVIDPSQVKTWLSLAQLFVSSGRFDKAEEDRVAGGCCQPRAPSEPCVTVSRHTAQAFQKASPCEATR